MIKTQENNSSISKKFNNLNIIQNYDTENNSNKSHKLKFDWVFWFLSRQPGSKMDDYNNSLNQYSVVDTVELFWESYCYLKRPKDLDPITDLVLFKKGLKPIWEDSPQGGKWIIRLKKGIASRYWENLLLALIGDQFKVGEEICGAVISVRQTEDILSLWNKDATNKDVTYKIKETLKVVLDLPEKISMEYKAHNSSLADNSSFRNTTKH